MNPSSHPPSRDLVLVGGGHTHALVLKSWAMRPFPGARVTLINPDPVAAYSGMLPGCVAGHYRRDDLDIDLMRLGQAAGARIVIASATGIDRQAREVQIANHPPIGYDILSLDIGITSRMPALDGFVRHGIPAKPLGPFSDAWEAFCASDRPAQVAVLGGGVAGAELAMAMMYRLTALGRDPQVTIIDRAQALSALGPRAAARLRGHLSALGVRVLETRTPLRVHADHIELAGGETVPAWFATGAAGAVPYPWLAQTGLADDAGFIPVDSRLRSRDPRIFAAGDCAEMVATPRVKAGVYAVRQAPVLNHNLRAGLAETGGLKPYVPQGDYLKLVSLGARSAQAERFGLAVSGPLLWRLKDRIDRRFMARFAALSAPAAPDLPWPRAAGAATGDGDQPLCGGCGAKIGAPGLRRALRVAATGDDAAILEGAGVRQVISTDHLRAFIADPVTFARIAAVHALGDIWAMGADPQVAMASVTLPRQSPRLAERHLSEIMQAAGEVMTAAGACIAGGHSTLGAEMSLGFTVTGLCPRPPITLAGAQPGDRLILTKPLGSGVLMAAHMQLRASGPQVAAGLHEMMKPQGAAARLLVGAHAMTDVTGFGLAGHLGNICAASGVGARVDVAHVPLMKGALALSRAGVRSSLYAENRLGFSVPDDPRTALLFDPQTGGGLLAVLPGDPQPICRDLRAAGFTAAIIGEITDKAGQIDIV